MRRVRVVLAMTRETQWSGQRILQSCSSSKKREVVQQMTWNTVGQWLLGSLQNSWLKLLQFLQLMMVLRELIFQITLFSSVLERQMVGKIQTDQEWYLEETRLRVDFQ